MSPHSRVGLLGPGVIARGTIALVVIACLPAAARAEQPQASFASVRANVETAPVRDSGDAADDAALWVDRRRPSRSLVVATDKRGGLALYNLAGRELRYYADSQPNNVDLRGGFPLAGRRVSLVATSDRRTDSIRVYVVDSVARRLRYAARRRLSTGIGVAGLCMYRSPRTGRHYVFVGDNSGTVQQWQLVPRGKLIDARKVRTLRFDSVTEGCVADDALARLYLSEEDVGIWRLGAEPGSGTSRSLVDSVRRGRLAADVEGLALYRQRGASGYLIASSQGSDSFAIYRRSRANAYVASFRVVDGRIDGVTHTDGIDATSSALGRAFPHGLFIAQDDRNDGRNQNFKLVRWERIARATALRRRAATSGRATYYVDSRTGNDSRRGTSAAAAWRTLERVSAARLRPGDRVLLARGGSWRGQLEIASSGIVGRRIVLDAYGRGALPAISGASACVVVRGSFVTVRHLRVRNCSWAGIELRGRRDRVQASVVTGNAAGIYVPEEAVGAAIVGNRIRDNNRMSVLTRSPDDDDSGAFGIAVHGEATEIAFNIITGSDAFSFDYGRDGAAVEVYGARATYVHHNLAVGNDAFSELGNRAANTRFVYNVVRSSLPTSVFLVTRGAESRQGPVRATTLYHNTASLTGTSSKGVVCHGGCGPKILTMRDNIVSARMAAYADRPFDEDFDLFFGSLRLRPGPHTLVGAPAFRDRRRDLRLKRRSPAVDRGIGGLGYRRDFAGRRVPADGNGDGGARPDLGAYERPAVR